MPCHTPLPPGSIWMPSLPRVSGLAKVAVRPWKRTTPRSGVSSPAMTRRIVDFPAPFVPRRVSVSPSITSNDTSKSTWTGP